MPDGGGDISHAFELARDIDKTIPVYVLPWPSPEHEQPSSIEEMATTMIAHIKAIRISGPCALAGYSNGGILAYEIAKQLLISGYPISFLGLIDTYASVVNRFSETEMFLTFLHLELPAFKTLNDPVWWSQINKLTLSEAIDEIHKMNFDLNSIDIEWEALLSKQRFNYQNMCAAYRIDSIPINIHLFKANSLDLNSIDENDKDEYEKHFNYPKLGWENHNQSIDLSTIPVNGNHRTMLTDPTNRSLLGAKLTESLLQKTSKTQ